ncbi:hypothetical protein [Streptomyces althioticus]|uniref:hypothetical protein n=1 Tax=Streptomyces althioticus TaxID=83380 RepID=UPI0038737E9C|nr:hypothetical protein OG872_00150 [Streptomyces althioticus]WTC27372.1 hypothetical protein OG872_33895 [Streptomyces althioticus]
MGTGSDGTGGNTTTYGWDDRNNPVSQKLPLGATASVSAYQTIAGTDLPSDMTGANGRKDSFTYDTNGNTLSVTTSGTAGATREYTYNDADPTCGGFEGQRCTAKDGNGKATSLTYDDQGNLVKVKPPAPLGETTYTYDALGRVETVKDGRGTTTVYAYDTRDRVREVSSTHFTVTYSCDGDGNMRSRTDASGTTKWDYDKLNRESVRTLQNGAQTALAYTPGGDIDAYTDPTGTTDYTWDKAGRHRLRLQQQRQAHRDRPPRRHHPDRHDRRQRPPRTHQDHLGHADLRRSLLQLRQRGQGHHQDPHPHRQHHQLQDHLHLRLLGPPPLRLGSRRGRHAQGLVAVLLGTRPPTSPARTAAGTPAPAAPRTPTTMPVSY